MNAGQREELSRWAEALVQSDDQHTAAAGRAIQSLCVANAGRTVIERRELMRFANALGGAKAAELRSAGRAIRSLCDENAGLKAAAPARRPARRTLRVRRRGLAIGGGALVLLAGGAVIAARAAAPDLGATGPAPHSLVGRKGLAALAFSAQGADTRWMLDGRPVRPVAQSGHFVYRPSKLRDGRHTLVISRPARFYGSRRMEFTFTIDTQPPTLQLDGPAVTHPGMPVVVTGVLDPRSRLERNGTRVAVESDGDSPSERNRPRAASSCARQTRRETAAAGGFR